MTFLRQPILLCFLFVLGWASLAGRPPRGPLTFSAHKTDCLSARTVEIHQYEGAVIISVIVWPRPGLLPLLSARLNGATLAPGSPAFRYGAPRAPLQPARPGDGVLKF